MVPDGTTAGEPAAVLMKVRSSADGGPVSKYKRDPKRVSLFSVYPGGLYLAGFALRRVLSPDFGETRERETVVSLREKNKKMRESSAVMADRDGHGGHGRSCQQDALDRRRPNEENVFSKDPPWRDAGGAQHKSDMNKERIVI